MASNPPQRPISLAQSIDEANLDGQVTPDEAIANTDGLKLIQIEKPIIVNKPLGAVEPGDLPAKDEIDDSLKKNIQFLDVIMGHEGEFNLKEIETLFLQQRYADLPAPLGRKGSNQTPYNMQLGILPQGSGIRHIIKHVKFTHNTKVNHQTIRSMAHGQPLEINLQKHFREGSRGFQSLLEGLGGFQVRYFKLVASGSSSKPTKETEDIRKGFQFIKGTAQKRTLTRSTLRGQKSRSTTLALRSTSGNIKEFLRCLGDQGFRPTPLGKASHHGH